MWHGSPAFCDRAFLCALSAYHSIDQTNDKPDRFDEGSPDHEARHNLHGKPKSDQNEVAELKRLGS
jgi:hypothetical protein